MFKVTIINDAGLGTIDCVLGSFGTKEQAKEAIDVVLRGGFWGKGRGVFGIGTTGDTFFCPRYIKRVHIVEEEET